MSDEWDDIWQLKLFCFFLGRDLTTKINLVTCATKSQLRQNYANLKLDATTSLVTYYYIRLILASLMLVWGLIEPDQCSRVGLRHSVSLSDKTYQFTERFELQKDLNCVPFEGSKIANQVALRLQQWLLHFSQTHTILAQHTTP